MKKHSIIPAATVLICSAAGIRTNAQLSLSAQLRTRTELRDGQGSPLPTGAAPAFFTSQRTRLNVGYNMYRLKFGVTLQDVRVWGQDVSTINRTTTADNNSLLLHEAWAEILLTDTIVKNKALSLKIGRQELVYDDQRLIGNLDWLQQGRRHDAAVLKYETKGWMVHLAAAFNQNKENVSGTIYNSTPAGNYTSSTNGGTMYKSMQFLYVGKKLKNGNASFLFFTDQFSKYSTDSVNNKTYQQGSWGRATTGFYVNNTFNKVGVTGSAYYQFGKTATSQKLSAVLLSAFAQYGFSKKINAGVGVDYTSGGSKGTTSNTFDPLYGTPHKFWGLMDYFYAANPFGKGGLTDYYLKAKYKASDKFSLATDLHQFSSATSIGTGDNKKNFGQELDITGSYTLTKQIGIEAGYAHFFATPLLTSATIKNVTNGKTSANWAYVMINIKPDFLFK
ncbi:alginate export family protein [Segetibacter koreensis]|uniref:alginate export family protein n=1 Tax=Segetibacter koreensis TaxID=398037 RepID=UPI00036A5DFB|nr:alginate export family protein [Segetibacter koreensis]